MAIIKPTALISGIKGNMGGSTFYQSRYGNVMALKGKRKKKKCYEALIAAGVDEWTAAHDCNQLSIIAGGWSNLTQGQKQQWANTAIQVTWYNRFGDPYQPTGYLLYMQLSMNNWRTNRALLTNAPVLVSAPVNYLVVWGTAVAGGPTFAISQLADLQNYFVVLTVLRAYPGWKALPLGPASIPSNTDIKRNGNALTPIEASQVLAPLDLSNFWIALYGQIPTGYVAVIAMNFVEKTTGQSFVGSTHLHTFT